MTRRVLCFSFFRLRVVGRKKVVFVFLLTKKMTRKARGKQVDFSSLLLLHALSRSSAVLSLLSHLFLFSLSLSRARATRGVFSLCLSLFLSRAFHHTHASHVCFLKKKRSRFFKCKKKSGQNDPRTFCLSESSIEREEEDSTRAVSRVSFFSRDDDDDDDDESSSSSSSRRR